jgi:tetratricopeptide (TPR) repeat protein
MDELERTGGGRTVDIAYHRGRAYYYLGYYEEAALLLNEYALNAGQTETARVSAAYYWIGESLLALGQLDRARDFFQAITDWYPQSAKYEAASYRIALIKQKKVEMELLALLKWSHEEYLKTIEEYRSRERTYDQALSVYQRQQADRERDSRLVDLENTNTEYRRQLSEAQERIRTLEGLLGPQGAAAASNLRPEDSSLRGWATQLRREMEKDAANIENSGSDIP